MPWRVQVGELLELSRLACRLQTEGLVVIANHCLEARFSARISSGQEVPEAEYEEPAKKRGRKKERGKLKTTTRAHPPVSKSEPCLSRDIRRNKSSTTGEVGTNSSLGSEFQLNESGDNEYSRLIDTANAPIFGVDIYGNVTVWNKCAANKSGYSSEDTMGHHLVTEFITEDFRESVQEVLFKALQGEETANFEMPLITKDGRRLEILLNATSRKDVSGNIIGVVGIGQVSS